MMILSLIALGAMTHFGGGTANDLAKSLSGATGRSVVIYTARPKKIDPFDYDASSLDELARTWRAKADLIMAPGVNYIFSDGFLPAGHVPARLQGNGPSSPSGGKPLTADNVKDGKVTVSTDGGDTVTIASIANPPLSPPITVDPYFREMGVYVQVKDLPEKDFINYVAKAIGARAELAKGKYTLAIDGNEVRTRAIHNIDVRLKTASKDDAERTRDELLKGALQAATSDQISTMLASKVGEVQIPLERGTPLGTLAIARINTVEALQGNTGNRGSVLQRLNPRTPSYAVITPTLEVFLDLAVRGGRTGSRVRM